MMTREERIAHAVKGVISRMMDQVLLNVLVKSPFLVEAFRANTPLYAALVPDEIFKGSHFERRFTTPFGGVWEKLAEVVAKEAHGQCIRNHSITGEVGRESLRRIQEVLNWLEHPAKGAKRKKPDWEAELGYIKAGGGDPIPLSVTCDLFVYNPTLGTRFAVELKAPLPNSDQTKVSKEKIFKLMAMDPVQVDQAYYALPYNPYGRNRSDYKWSYPARWFNMHKDECVLIGEEFWEKMGGEGSYQKFIDEVNSLGTEYRERIYREYLGMEPPSTFDQALLK